MRIGKNNQGNAVDIFDADSPAGAFFNTPVLKYRQNSEETSNLKPGQSRFAKTRPRNLLLATLPDAVFSKLTPYLENIVLTGEYLYQPGDSPDYLYFPETAGLSDFQILEDGRTIKTAMTGQESVVGLLDVLRKI